MINSSLVKIEKISKYFGKTRILNHVSFEIPKGSVLGILGADQQLVKGQDIVKGMITVKYSDYLINKNLPDYIFKKKRID